MNTKPHVNDLLSNALCNSYISMEHSAAIETIFAAIMELTENNTIKGLAQHGKALAFSMVNDNDLLREEIELCNTAGRMN